MNLRKPLLALLITLAGLTTTSALWAEELEDARMRCEAEAVEAGITDAAEQEEYVRECLAASGLGQEAQPQE